MSRYRAQMALFVLRCCRVFNSAFKISMTSPPQMINDPIYSEFISPLYRQERLRAERAEARAEQYAALLKKAGLLAPE